jgi:hypothetical protein
MCQGVNLNNVAFAAIFKDLISSYFWAALNIYGPSGLSRASRRDKL